MDILIRGAGSSAAEIVKYIAKPIICHVSYLFRFKKIVDDLIKAKTDLQLQLGKVQEDIKQAEKNTEVVEEHVKRWLTNVNQLMEKVHALENEVQVNLRFCNGWCPDWIQQYKLGKEAVQKTNDVKKLLEEGKFSKLTHRAPNPGIDIFPSGDFEVFESTNLAFQQIMEALRDDNSKRIGLHGMGGIGKTTLVKEVYRKTKELNIFNDIVMTAVSRTPKVREIQHEIAGCLDLELNEGSDTANANRICSRIKNKKILIIVDDIWDAVNLEDYGIPSFDDDNKGCKMLLTTRSEHVCNVMHCQRKIRLNFLLKEESLALMRKTAGVVNDDPVWNDAVLNVVKKCEGLPLAINTIGKALRGKNLNAWNAAMHDLNNSRLVEIEGVVEKDNIYVVLKWSYDQLKCRTKLCFLLCCLFPEGYNIPIEELTRYAMVLDEYQDFHSLESRRSQVRTAIDCLKDYSLLLEAKGFGNKFVKMHDMVRDVGLWIASKWENDFKLIACTSLERSIDFERVTAISLINYKTKPLPNNLVCPRLNILLLGRIQRSKEISNALFEGMNCLKVLSLHDKILSSQSLELLTNLRTLCLKGCDFSDDLSSLGKLKRLETLSFYECEMVALPSEFGEMESLKMLDLTHCTRLKQIPPNVIRRLAQLEELIFDGSFQNWDVERTTSKIGNANLSELNSLPELVTLSLQLKSKRLPKGFVFPDLKRYLISINSNFWSSYCPFGGSFSCIDSRAIAIKDLNASSMNALKPLLHTVEYILIESCEMECIVDTTGGNHAATFGNLVQLYLEKMRCLRTICEGPNQDEIFSNLTGLSAIACPILISLFSLSLAQSLKKLEELHVERCHEMKQIISEEGMILESHHQPTGFPKLKTIKVVNCKNLEYIFPISIARDLPQLESLELRDLPQLKQVLGQNREGEVGDCEIESHHQLTGFPKLKTIKVVNCKNLEYIFPISIARDLPQLESLELQDLPQLKQVLGQNREGEVGDCEIESHHQPTSFPKLKTIEVVNCENLENIFPISIARDLPQLESLRLEDLPQLKQVFGHEDGGDDGDGNNSVLSKLRNLILVNLPELVSLGGGNSSSVWPSLERLEVVNCPKVKLADVEANVPALQKLQNLRISLVDNWNAISSDLMQGLLNVEILEIENCGGFQEVIKLEGLLTIKGEQQNLLLQRLRTMLLIDLHELRCMWKGTTRLINLNNLEDLRVIGCKKLTHLFTPALAQSLQKLQYLKIERCDELEYLIVENVEEQVSSESHLQPLCFPKLEDVRVRYCNKLKYLFPMTIADSLLELQNFVVEENPQLMEVFTHEGDTGVQKDVTLPQLHVMDLRSLPNLVNFCPKNYQFIMPKMCWLSVKSCKNMRMTFTRTPDRIVLKNGEVAQIDEPTGISTISQVLNRCPANNDITWTLEGHDNADDEMLAISIYHELKSR